MGIRSAIVMAAVDSAQSWWYPALGLLFVLSIVCLVLGWRGRSKENFSSIGTSLLTGVLVTGAFFLIQQTNENNQKALEKRDAERAARTAAEQDRRQQLIAARQSLGVRRDLRRADLEARELPRFDLSGKDLRHADLSGAKLRKAHLKAAVLYQASLDDADLSGADVSDARMYRASLNGASLSDVQAHDVHLEGAALGPNAAGRSADLSGAIMINAHLRHACLARANLRGANLGGADLSDAVLTGADLRGATLIRDGVPVNLNGAWIVGAKVDPSQRAFLRAAHRSGVRGSLHTRPSRPAKTLRDRVIGVSDGDTLLLAHRGWVRLIGINATEPTSRLGREAWSYLKRRQESNATVYYRVGRHAREHREHDGRGRWRAYVWFADGRSVNETMLDLGYAVRQRVQEDPRETARLDRAQSRAQGAGRRIWSFCGGR